MTALQIARAKNLEDQRLTAQRNAEEQRHNRAQERLGKWQTGVKAATDVLGTLTKLGLGGINDISWHAPNQTMLETNASIPWGVPTGTIFHYELEHAPTVLTLTAMTTPGSTVDQSGCVNVPASAEINRIAGDIMAKVWARKSGTPPFAKADLWQYIYAVANGYMVHATLLKLISVLNTPSDPNNLAIRDGILSSMGIPQAQYVDVISNKNRYVALANDLAYRLEKFKMPGNLNLFPYVTWVFSRICIDSRDGTHGQLYHVIPYAYYTYDWANHQLQSVLWDAKGQDTWTVDGLGAICNNIITHLQDNDDSYAIMRSAIQDAYQDMGYVSPALIDSEFRIPIENNIEFLEMFRNARWTGSERAPDNINVTQDENFELVFDPQKTLSTTSAGADGVNLLYVGLANKNYLLNTEKGKPTAADSLLMSRWSQWWYFNKAKDAPTDEAVTIHIGCSTILAVELYMTVVTNMSGDDGPWMSVEIPVLWARTQAPEGLVGYNSFYYRPNSMLGITESATPGPDIQITTATITNLDNYTTVKMSDLAGMLKIDTMALLGQS